MSSPLFRTNSGHVDQNFPFYYSDNLWLLQDDTSSTILSNDGYDNGYGLDHIFQGQENSSLVAFEASYDPPCPLLHENSMLLPIEEVYYHKTNCELNTGVFLDHQENSALAVPITDKGLLENRINDHEDHNILPTTLKAFENICQILEENHDASDKELQGNSANHNSHENSLSNCTLEGTSNDSWSLLEEGSKSLNIENHENSGLFDSRMLADQQAELSPVQATLISIDKGLLGKKFSAKTKEKNHKLKKQLQSAKLAVQVQSNGDQQGKISKKQEHNAKEKIRRMKLNDTYLALGALLPDHRRTKKRRSTAPGMIDRALEYIPELEKEIEDLTLRKNNLLSTIEKQNLRETPQLSDHKLQAPTVSLHEVAKGEVIIQIICIDYKDQETSVFSNLLQNVEAQGMSILSASTLQVCMERVSYHLHIQMNGSSLAADYIAILRERVISWLA
ncbi:hypothetical protein ACOSQ2_004629 [Xanthoceras sorbifolium]